MFGHLTPRSGEHSRLNGCPVSLDHYTLTCSPDFRQPYQEAERIGKAHPATFDTLDFDVYTNQKWDRLQESHAQDIVVHYPDGHQSKGLAAHIEELKPMFVFAPDTRIQVHPVKIASGEWTSVIGVIED
ncbi:nuclear transport factor 2 family protein [Pseudomonas proteolytica]|uniref:nuclear transport factor 2 family protein n=1 Tax=Pseudomonas sp. MF7448 TaxID=2797537 RepID=UPI00190DE718|nr:MULTISPECIES: nuclear transport factor 2 family protein [Pseudomonas]MBK3440173.1 nuclear transport factor 2 family protein [Pseudomonas sp. MF7448]USW93407.1 nuclear transport factor 2 family protein [Pseudomonas proteolytica]USX02690.1 nuclear transport factor 2 family protein [Pseudomonas proteolytica]